MSSTEAQSTHVVVVGGGFAGVAATKQLAKHNVAVTLIDKNTYHQFQPLLYQVATAQLAQTDVMRPLRELFRHDKTVNVQNATITSVDPAANSVTTSEGSTFEGSHLILANGAQPNFFGIQGAEENSFALYTAPDATRLRDRIIGVFEDAERNPELIDRGALTFVIVGGGATGVEIAGSLADMVSDVMPGRYHDLDVSRARVILVDRGSVVLGPFSESAHRYAATALEEKGVTLEFGRSVTAIEPDRVTFADGSEIKSHCVVWAGGLQTPMLAGTEELPHGPHGRITTGADLSVDGHPGIYAIGDTATAADSNGDPLPQLGAVALQAGEAAANSILAEITGQAPSPFKYHDKGIMAMIGRHAAVAEVGSKHHELHGPVAHAAWLGVHAWLLSSVRDRVDTFITWGWDSITHNHAPAIPDNPDKARIDWSGNEDDQFNEPNNSEVDT